MNLPEIYRVSSTSLVHAHAHNDYEKDRPLADALNYGFCSIEVDICCFIGKLFVAHSIFEFCKRKDLEKHYLKPLRALIQQNNGTIFSDNQQLFMLIDIKAVFSKYVYRKLKKILAKYADILTSFENGIEHRKPVVVVLSGKSPLYLLEKEKVRYAGCDGRMEHLDSDYPPSLMPLISENWNSIFEWDGEEAFSAAERQKLVDFCIKAHSRGRKVRFWAIPDKKETQKQIWRELLNAGVDLINTDDLEALSSFLLDYNPA